jgi:hypothetical protein
MLWKKTLREIARVMTVGLLLAGLLIVPFSSVPVSAEGGSTGQPFDSTGKSMIVDDNDKPASNEDVVLTEMLKLTTIVTLMSL